MTKKTCKSIGGMLAVGMLAVGLLSATLAAQTPAAAASTWSARWTFIAIAPVAVLALGIVFWRIYRGREAG